MKILSHHRLAILLFNLLVLGVSGCTNNSEARIVEDARRFSAVSRTDPAFRPQLGDTLSWFGEVIVQDTNSAVKATAGQRELIHDIIERELIRKLYRFTDNEAEADYVIAAAVLLDNSERSREITELVQINPGLASAFDDYEQGTLSVIIIPSGAADVATAPILWRGSIQAYTMGDSLPPQAQLERLEGILMRLTRSVPIAGE